MDIKILADIPEDELEAGVKEGPDETAEPAPAADSIGQSSDPVRLYLKEMGNFQLLSREGDRFELSGDFVKPSLCHLKASDS
jgi:hypothetical protein